MSRRSTAVREPTRASREVIDQAIKDALKYTLRADEPPFDRLPVPVRYRATGAIKTWQAARDLAGAAGHRLSALLGDRTLPPIPVFNDLARFIEQHASWDYRTSTGRIILAHGVNTVFWQAFWARDGALYEPTPALHRLLDATDIAESMPLRMIQLPAPAICLTPDPSSWDQHGGIEALAIFAHSPKEADASPDAYGLTFVSFSHWTHPEPRTGVEFLQFAGDGSDRTIEEALVEAMKSPSLVPGSPLSVEETTQRWRQALNYAAKMLLYLSLDEAQVTHERPYSTTPRIFTGLGKRKRAEQMEQFEQLYDRYVVGPAVLNGLPETNGQGDRDYHEVRAHWRRGLLASNDRIH